MAKFSRDLNTHQINFLLRVSIKGQVITDFLVELLAEGPNTLSTIANMDDPNLWTLHVDGLNNMYGSGLGIALIVLEDIQIEHNTRLNFNTSNNEAEYKALIVATKEM